MMDLFICKLNLNVNWTNTLGKRSSAAKQVWDPCSKYSLGLLDVLFVLLTILCLTFIAVNRGFALLLHTGAVLLSVAALLTVHRHQKKGTFTMSLQPQIKLFHQLLHIWTWKIALWRQRALNVSAAAFEFLVRGIMLGLLAATCRALVSSAVPKQKQKGTSF